MLGIFGSIGVFLEDGFMYAILAMGYYITYSILDFPDLSVEGTVLSGGICFALLVRAGINPWLALIMSFFTGALLGSITGLIHVKLKIRPLLCGIIVSTALISINLVVTVLGMGGNLKGEDALTTVSLGRSVPNILKAFPSNLIPERIGGVSIRKLVVFFAVVLIFKILLDVYLKTKNGLLLRATGNNERFVAMLAQNPGRSKILGLAIGNAFAAVSGALIVQSRGNVNQGMGLGMIVIGLASVMIGTSLFSRISFIKPTTKVVLGAIIYQACLSIATLLGVPSAYNKLIMVILFTIALFISDRLRKNQRGPIKCLS